MYSKIMSISLIFFMIIASCKERTIDQLCSENGFARGILLEKLDYRPLNAKLYLYKANSEFKELEEIKDSIIIYKRDSVTILQSRDEDRLFLDYDYRFIIDDTICFDLSEFVIKADTAGRTMGGWHIICALASYKCNDSIYKTTGYNYRYIAPPFGASRIIKKRQYDKL